MRVIDSPQEMLSAVEELRRNSQTIGFVPTLGNLHQGHAKLIQTARTNSDVVVVSVFVNPVQFSQHEDLDAYPHTEKDDMELCRQERVDIVFLPAAADIYAAGQHPLTQVNIPSMSSLHCGVSRPTHFMGVLTVVALLFNLVKPHCAAFGKKDFQQLRLIQIMVKELHFPVKILAVDTGRAADGLALSSRNFYLTKEERELAPHFYKTLVRAAKKLTSGSPDAADYRIVEKVAQDELTHLGFKTDYVNLVRQNDLQPAQPQDKSVVIVGAVYLGKARLIDNIDIPGDASQETSKHTRT